MLCRNPWIQGLQSFPCGRCDPCRRQRKRLWTHRILLESQLHSDNAFVTLTYAEESLPAGASLVKRDYQLFLKSLRKYHQQTSGRKVRFFAVGEYGDEGGRPHYHLALFGFPSCLNGNTKRNNRGVPVPESCCPVCRALHRIWGRGLIDCGTITHQSAAYISGYVTKKMTHRHHPWLQGRDPEFAQMSLKPGIGYGFMHEVASALLQYDYLGEGDVPVTLAHGKTQRLLGRYLRRKLRVMIGRDEKALPDEKRKEEMRSLYLASLKDPQFVSIKKVFVDQDTPRVISMEAREKIFKQRKKL